MLFAPAQGHERTKRENYSGSNRGGSSRVAGSMIAGPAVCPTLRPVERRVGCEAGKPTTKGQKSAQLTELRRSPTGPEVEVSRGVDPGRRVGQMAGRETQPALRPPTILIVVRA